MNAEESTASFAASGWRPPQCPIDLMSVIQKVTALKTETKHYKDVDDIAAEVDKRLHRKGMPSNSKAYHDQLVLLAGMYYYGVCSVMNFGRYVELMLELLDSKDNKRQLDAIFNLQALVSDKQDFDAFHVKLDKTYEKLTTLSKLWQDMQKKTTTQYELAASAEYTLGMCVRMQPDLGGGGGDEPKSAGSEPESADGEPESAGSSPGGELKSADVERRHMKQATEIVKEAARVGKKSPILDRVVSAVEILPFVDASKAQAPRVGKKSPILDRVASAVEILPFADAAKAQASQTYEVDPHFCAVKDYIATCVKATMEDSGITNDAEFVEFLKENVESDSSNGDDDDAQYFYAFILAQMYGWGVGVELDLGKSSLFLRKALQTPSLELKRQAIKAFSNGCRNEDLVADQRGRAPYYGAFEKVEEIARMEAKTKEDYILKIEAIVAMRAYARTAAEVDGCLPEKAVGKQMSCHGMVIEAAQNFRAAGFNNDFVDQQADKSMKALGTLGYAKENFEDFDVEDVPECAQCGTLGYTKENFEDFDVEDVPECAQCGEPETPHNKLSQCSRCKQVSYCTRECQRKAWKAGHKNACRDFVVVAEKQRQEALQSAIAA